MKTLLRPLELMLRHALVYPLFRLLFRNPPREELLELRSVRKLLILRYDRIGDIIVTTPIFRALKSVHPNLVLGVVASSANAELIRHDPHVDRIHVLSSNWFRFLRMIREARREKYDVVLNFIFNRTTSGGVLANLIAPAGIKIGQGADKYRFYFNRLLRLPRGDRHMVEVLAAYIEEVFGRSVEGEHLGFTISLQNEDRANVRSFLKERRLRSEAVNGSSQRFVVVNLSATDHVRKLSARQADCIIATLSGQMGLPTVVISGPEDDAWKHETVGRAMTGNVYAFPGKGSAQLREIAALIGDAWFVVTPDTSIIHVSSAMETPVLGLFTPLQVTAEWLPWGIKHRAILAGLGEPVGSIALDRIEQELKLFDKDLRSQ